MRLTRVTLWNYRSYWSDDGGPPSVDVELGKRVNYLVGANNVGKSNLLRAIGLALDPGATYDASIDRPQGKAWGPSILLEFAAGPAPTAEVKKLLQEVEAYERTIPEFQEPSLASEGVIRLFVEINENGRYERFATRDTLSQGKVQGRNNVRIRALDRLHQLVRFVDIKSGEDLQGLFRRGFQEVLAGALGAAHKKSMQDAAAAREAYQEALGKVLRPIATHIQDRLGRYVRDIQDVDLRAAVPPVEDALADAQVYLKDAVLTALDQKGTGVRGATLLLLLSFIAESARSAVVFGIEEPEAFLHPEAHRELGAGLERFTQREDVTLLVTTHSPFLFRPDGEADGSAVFLVRKDEQGRSTVARDLAGAARTDLFGSEILSTLLAKAEEVPDRARLILVVEGQTDARYLELAAQKLGIAIDDIHLVYWSKAASEKLRGASFTAFQAVTLASRHAPARAVAALFDTDDDGKAGYGLLAERFSWKKKKPEEGLFVFHYEQWVPGYNVPVEAEDIFANETLKAFLAEPGHEDFCTGTKKREKSGHWHYDLSTPGKIAFVKWLEEKGTAGTFEPWREILAVLKKIVEDRKKAP